VTVDSNFVELVVNLELLEPAGLHEVEEKAEIVQSYSILRGSSI